jgi:HAD superfamily phosphoserine phosphatase-like hydrolase
VIGLVAFDLDGTLVRGKTCVEALAETVGRVDECAAFERLAMRDRESVADARSQMAAWYREHAFDDLCAGLARLTLAPGAAEGFRVLRRHTIKTAIVSITWRFAVDWFAARLGADYTAGTVLVEDGSIDHFWPEDKGRWLDELRRGLELDQAEVAAVGDSHGDSELLAAAGARFYVGADAPPDADTVHLPDSDIAQIARLIVDHATVQSAS